jgi:hypothetical protein
MEMMMHEPMHGNNFVPADPKQLEKDIDTLVDASMVCRFDGADVPEWRLTILEPETHEIRIGGDVILLAEETPRGGYFMMRNGHSSLCQGKALTVILRSTKTVLIRARTQLGNQNERIAAIAMVA